MSSESKLIGSHGWSMKVMRWANVSFNIHPHHGVGLCSLAFMAILLCSNYLSKTKPSTGNELESKSASKLADDVPGKVVRLHTRRHRCENLYTQMLTSSKSASNVSESLNVTSSSGVAGRQCPVFHLAHQSRYAAVQVGFHYFCIQFRLSIIWDALF